MTYQPPSRNLWALFVLWFLCERPMHPYEMQRLIRHRHKDDVLPLKPSSLYHAIDQLEARGFIEASETIREGKRPERTVYRVTDAGREEATTWLRALLAEPQPESSQFVAAVSQVGALQPHQAAAALRERVIYLRGRLASLKAERAVVEPLLLRVVLLEGEYTISMLRAELGWVESIVTEIECGELSWSDEELDEMARRFESTMGSGEEAR